MSARIAVIGTGYVGLVSAVGLADFGNQVIGVDINEEIVAQLKAGRSTIYEHGLQEYLDRNLASGRLTFSSDVGQSVRSSDVVFVAVGTPSLPDDQADLSQVRAAVDTVSANLNSFKVIVTKSTVPVGTNRWIDRELAARADHDQFAVVSNPEFLREGSAVQDFFHPDRIIIGFEEGTDRADLVRSLLSQIYRPLYLLQTPFVWSNWETAELSKYASNAFLATKITFVNQMATLAEMCGADVHEVAKAMGMDGRIGPKFLHPGPGFGGSCFPKDTRAIVQTGSRYGVDMSLIREVVRANEEQKHRVVRRLSAILERPLKGARVCVLGLSFKAETDDVRESPAIAIVEDLLAEGASVAAHDPKAEGNFRRICSGEIDYYEDAFEAIRNADAIIIDTEWNEYRNLDLKRARNLMKGTVLFDARNVLEPHLARQAGLTYAGIGRT